MENEATRSFWDARAHERVDKERQQKYSRLGHIYETSCWKIIEPMLPASGAEVLEAGCGTGRWVARLAEKGLKTRLLDFSPEMVRTAKRLAQERGLEHAVTGYHVQDICNLHELADHCVDCVICLGEPLGLCDDPARAIAEMYRVLTPGGTIVCDAAMRMRLALECARKNDWEGAASLYAQGVLRSADGRPHWGFTEPQLEDLFRKAGFDAITFAPITPLLSFPPTPELFDALNNDETFGEISQLLETMEQDPQAKSISPRLIVAARKPE